MNVRFLNLKESKAKQNPSSNSLVSFCERKGIIKVKEKWEASFESDMKLEEVKLKEIYSKLKGYKSRKKRFELLKDCRETLMENIGEEKMTLADMENETLKELKETVVPERKPVEDRQMFGKKLPSEDDQSRTAPINSLVKFEFGKCSTPGSSPTFAEMRKEDSNLRTARNQLKKTAKKMTPTKKKLSNQMRNSPLARKVAEKLGLKTLPSVQLMASRLDQQQHPRPDAARDYGQVKNNLIITKPIFHSTGVQIHECTAADRARPS